MIRLLSREAHSRSFAKALTWRFTATIDTFVILHCNRQGRHGRHDRRYRNRHQDSDFLFSRTGMGPDPLGPQMNMNSVARRGEDRC
jgi:hypothetical protein